MVKSSGEIRVFTKTDLCTFENNKPLWTQMEVLEGIRHNCIQTGNILGIEKIKDPNWIENSTPDELKKYLNLVLIAIAHEDTRDNEGRFTELVRKIGFFIVIYILIIIFILVRIIEKNQNTFINYTCVLAKEKAFFNLAK